MSRLNGNFYRFSEPTCFEFDQRIDVTLSKDQDHEENQKHYQETWDDEVAKVEDEDSIHIDRIAVIWTMNRQCGETGI